MSVQVSYKKQLVFGIIFVLVFLLFIELISFVYLEQNNSCYDDLKKSKIYDGKSEKFLKQICSSYHSLLYYNTDQGLRFPIKYFEPNQYLENISINNQGIRGAEVPLEKSDDTFRIFVVGGSTTFGNFASSDSTTIPGYLQSLINEIDMDKKIEVFNLGVFARTSFEEVYDLKQNFLKYNPDLIIAYDGWNDLYQDFNRFEEGTTTSNLTDLSKIYNIIKRNYATFRVALDILNSFNTEDIKLIPDGENMKDKANAWVQNWDSICKLGKENNFETIVFLQPVLGTGEKPMSEWEKYKIETQGYTSVVPYYTNLQEKIPILNKKCFAAYDVSEIFNDIDEPIYITMGHMGDRGNEIVANEIFILITPHLLEIIHE